MKRPVSKRWSLKDPAKKSPQETRVETERQLDEEIGEKFLSRQRPAFQHSDFGGRPRPPEGATGPPTRETTL